MSEQSLIPAGRAGGALATFIPQNMDEVKRMAQWAAVGGMAPKSLTDGKNLEGATAACAIAIMAGAELGLTPMMALRSYAVVNGRPTLWGDGLIAVVMKSPLYKQGSLRKGYDEERNEGWCEVERTDGTKWRDTFSMKQATKAGLSSKKGPWQEYPDVMCTRRAISKTLNFVFADVLGGFVTEDEAFYAYETVDVTPRKSTALPDVPTDEPEPEPSPPTGQTTGEAKPGAADLAGTSLHNLDHPEGAENEGTIISGTSTESPVVAARTARDAPPPDMDAYFARIDEELEPYDDEEEFLAFWAETGIEAALAGDSASLDRAEELRRKHLARIEGVRRADAVAAGQQDIFAGGLPAVPDDEPELTQAQKIAGTP